MTDFSLAGRAARDAESLARLARVAADAAGFPSEARLLSESPEIVLRRAVEGLRKVLADLEAAL